MFTWTCMAGTVSARLVSISSESINEPVRALASSAAGAAMVRGGRQGRLTPQELREEVAKARNFYPKLGVFVLLTTSPNDVGLKKVAAELSRKRSALAMRVEIHGWDWIEGLLAQHFDLAIQYGLIAVVPAVARDAQPPSKIAQQIGSRFKAALELMNTGRDNDERFTLSGIARHLGLPDWQLLEEIAEGRSKASLADLGRIATGLGLNESWLVEGKDAPFAVDPEDYVGAEEQFGAIVRSKPREIVFVRQEEPDFESIVVAQIDDFKWIAFRWYHPVSSHVGGTGRRQLFEYCCLMRRLYRNFDFPGGSQLLGRHVSGADFRRLLGGEVYPGTLFAHGRNDDWWMDFAELAEDRVEGGGRRPKELREAIYIARTVLSEFQQRSSKNGWMRDILLEVGFPVRERKAASIYPIEAGTQRG